jgi:V/A-type H+-transporting ATPase subunit F
MYKIGVIGDRESVLAFMTLGFSVREVENAEEAAKALHEMAKSDYAVIYLTEQYALELSSEMAKYKDSALPAIVVIPGSGEYLGYGMASLKASVERAVGADILFKND